jgi:hypothetical protein
MVTIFTPGILYLFFKDLSLYQSLDIIKIVLFSLSIPSPILVFNISISIIIAYLMFTTERYKKGKRLKEEVINRVVITSSLFASAIFINLGFIALYIVNFTPSKCLIISGLVFDIIIVILLNCLLRKKVNLDLFNRDFPG